MEPGAEPIGSPLPPGPVGGQAAWKGSDLAARPHLWLHALTAAEVAEIDAAVQAHFAAGREMADISPHTFRLPTLSRRLAASLHELLEGRGFFMLRGLPVERYGMAEAAVAFLGIGAHLGNFRSQNAGGHLLGHVCNLGLDIRQPTTRYYQTDRELDFHSDSCDVVGLLCLRTARSGGESRIVSAVTIHDEMHRRRPDLWRQLFHAFPTDRRGEVPQGMQPWFDLPFFNWHAGRLSTHGSQYVFRAQETFPEARRLTAAELEAFAFMKSLCADPDMHLKIDFSPGDMQFLYNHHVLHARAEFEDWPEPERRRHLLRLWLAPPDDRPLPEAYAQRFGSVEPGRRGGIMTPGTRLTFSLDPV